MSETPRRSDEGFFEEAWSGMKVLFSQKRSAFFLALSVRLVLLVFGYWQDEHVKVKYTDIDYEVFSDGARYMSEGSSPYLRATYRYTPLLAAMMIPNTVFKSFGKILFVIIDLLIGYLIYLIVRGISQQEARVVTRTKLLEQQQQQQEQIRQLQKRAKSKGKQGMTNSQIAEYVPYYNQYIQNLQQEAKAMQLASVWLFNPIVINVSTRGNAESLICLIVVATLYCLLSRHLALAAILFGLSVHFKIYPVIYTLAFYLFVSCEATPPSFFGSLLYLFNLRRIKFALISAATFLLTTVACYSMYGYQFLYETYLYHVVRSDHRHNFSAYFYPIYLSMGETASTGVQSGETSLSQSLVIFMPQFFLMLAISLVYYKDLPFCAFLLTFVFVTFNKVITVQYFIWYFALLPLVLRSTRLSPWELGLILVVWFGSQALWLIQAYRLEFLGENVFLEIYLFGLIFFFVNTFIVFMFLRGHRFTLFPSPSIQS